MTEKTQLKIVHESHDNNVSDISIREQQYIRLESLKMASTLKHGSLSDMISDAKKLEVYIIGENRWQQ